MGKSSSSASEVGKYATLSIVWGIIAAAAFAVLPWVPINNGQQNETGITYISNLATNGFKNLNGGTSSSLSSDPLAFTLFILALFVPIAIVGVLATGFIARIRVPPMILARLHTFMGFVGLTGMLSLFITFVAFNKQDQQGFATAFGIIVLTSIVTRLQSRVRGAFQQRPTISSLGLLAIGYATIWLANQTSLTNVILIQIGLWLTLIAFGVVVYSGYFMQRHTKRAHR
jgi:hypothetical protein